MEIVLWGVRGSISSPSPTTQFYGANTTCIEVRTDNNDLLIFDAGSGLHHLGTTLPDSGVCHLFLSHGHADHIQGLGFFKPIHNPNWTIHVYVPASLKRVVKNFFDGKTFPVMFKQLRSKIVQHIVTPGKVINVSKRKNNPIKVKPFLGNHPGGSVAYKVYADESVFLYSGDHEITSDPVVRSNTFELLSRIDVAVVDAAYGKDDYHEGWGHSKWEDWVELAARAKVPCLVLSHHMQDRSDKELDDLQDTVMPKTSGSSDLYNRVYVAKEGLRFIPKKDTSFIPQRSDWMFEFVENLGIHKDESIILDRILATSREITQADAGTVFLVENNQLVFAYTHNDTLFPADSSYKHAYVNVRLPISLDSIAGYVASTGKTLNIPDVETLPKDLPYHFNDSFDKATGYQSKSMLVMPFFDRNKNLLGVLQLINSINPRSKKIQAFDINMENNVRLLAREAANVLEISGILRKNIYRMLKVIAIHDPTETGPHAERVGAISAELYQRWAEKHQKTPDEIRFFKGQIRLASMLHDVGKVGISDLILKKKARLTEEEYITMRNHTRLGASLLSSETKDITELAHDVALHHHQKWNGQGYVGSDDSDRLEGTSIPLVARIAAIADVFDALVSSRCYKNAWSFEEARLFLNREAGQHFDPLLVECFNDIFDLIHKIYERFPDVATA
ncbi:HD domain-containing phosphohydrolase [Desulfovibrio litoralis]|uniref:GAF domain-containing protein n=1 Tax=Desulfovibrio litoralis DSM 11393 TaxID=1121455 RepID=A0A1M7SFP8_9BACT|nr:HD domain-containing phosphohydrolase [Desulfovibrio litoralis]SHN57346.1 GAF domain-containing protein [Desulfovibrio litoralis DSM 11393]